VVTAGQRGDAP
jgi:transposase